MDEEYLHQELSHSIIGAAIEVHRMLGPGFSEAVYQAALEHELKLRGIPFESKKLVTVEYKGAAVATYYLDLVADGKIVIELKALSELVPVHESQVIAYLKASGLKLGLLFNFGKQRLQTKRIIY